MSFPGGDVRVVAHYTRIFLPVTEGWIYDQIRWCRDWRSIVLARKTRNLEQFPWQPTYSLSDMPAFLRLVAELEERTTGIIPRHLKACRNEGVSVIHAHFGDQGRAALPLARSLRVPLVTSFYGRDMSCHRGGMAGLRRHYERLFREGTLFIAEGPAARKRLRLIGCPEEKLRIHRLGIDLDAVEFRQRDFTGEQFFVLMAGRFVEKKGLPYGVETFCRVAVSHPELHLTVVGDAEDNAAEKRIRSELQRIVRTHRMESRVRFTGFLRRDEFAGLMSHHHLFLQPSVTARDGDSEGGHPVTLTQAAAAGLPIIATRHADIPEVVVDGMNGWLVEERNVGQLVTALEQALENRGHLAEFSVAGRRRVEQDYDGRRETMDALYREAVDLSAAAPSAVTRGIHQPALPHVQKSP